MELFELKDFEITFSPQALMLKPFKKLWDRDKSKGKAKATAELGYIWFMEDVRSDFYDIEDKELRHNEVMKFLVGLPSDWKPDEKVEEAREFYIKRSETISTVLLKDTLVMLNNLRQSLKSMDFEERDKSGKPIHDPTKALDTANKLPGMIQTIKKIFEEIEKEGKQGSLMRGGREKAIFEDGIE